MKTIKLTKGQVALVDDEDYEWLNQWKWHAIKRGNTFYACRYDYSKGKKNATLIHMHRLIFGLPSYRKLWIDHKDRNGLNNSRSNLRIATHAQNMANRASANNSTSKYVGVCWDKFRNKWLAQFTKNGTCNKIGRFENEQDAAIAYNKKAIELHGEFANLNVI